VAAEVDDFAIGHVERMISARVPTPAYSYGVTPRLKRCLEGLMVGEGADGLGVNQDFKPAAPKLDA
jgi:hypothetical protein